MSLRHWVILRRISYGTRTEQDSRVLAIFISVIETCRKRQQSPWLYLAVVIDHQRTGRADSKIASSGLVGLNSYEKLHSGLLNRLL